jgi:hypothetical protein
MPAQHKDTQHKDTQHKDTQHNNAQISTITITNTNKKFDTEIPTTSVVSQDVHLCVKNAECCNKTHYAEWH